MPGMLVLLGTLLAGVLLAPANESSNSRGWYNDGTQKLQAGKLREAELALQTAVARNHEAVQSVALYNLAHVRFQQGADVLKENPNGQSAVRKGDAANALGEAALRAADHALAGYDLDAIVAAYMQGRGARKELKAAAEAVKKALDKYGAVIARWQRASGDFKSARELRGHYEAAQFNAEVVDRSLAKLIDQQEALQMCMKCAGDQRQELKQKMDKLKELMPESLKQQCENGEEEDEELEDGKLPKEGQEEPKPRDGHELWLTPEEALRLLEAMQLDGNRKLPMGFEENRDARPRSGRPW